MMTIKEIFTFTGISTGNLRYYDSINLLCPTERQKSVIVCMTKALWNVYSKFYISVN